MKRGHHRGPAFRERTDSLTRPLSMYRTDEQRSPCAKMVSSGSRCAMACATCRESSSRPPCRLAPCEVRLGISGPRLIQPASRKASPTVRVR
jgi:hypothetical protein